MPNWATDRKLAVMAVASQLGITMSWPKFRHRGVVQYLPLVYRLDWNNLPPDTGAVWRQFPPMQRNRFTYLTSAEWQSIYQQCVWLSEHIVLGVNSRSEAEQDESELVE
ncbi:hypothetical protein B0H17DRAFT_1137489 [Mycena rosella]|uniref:Uncharacterized protein n=1 Tax=Mycena rosella TaxID=1033263 RepID=A0AAD7D8Z8_MYCRO|nr:hypothetical protein B0H17DRAFT_1137489 [Mycena rosella]